MNPEKSIIAIVDRGAKMEISELTAAFKKLGYDVSVVAVDGNPHQSVRIVTAMQLDYD